MTAQPTATSPPSASLKPAPTPSGPIATKSAAPAKVGPGYQVFTNSDGTVVRWNPCAPIHYAVNLGAAGSGGGAAASSALSDVQAAVAKVSAASGLVFVYDGMTSIVPTKAWLDAATQPVAGAPQLVIAWAPAGSGAGRSDLFGADADGEGGWWESGTSADGVHWVWQIKRGFVVLDPAGAATYAPGFGAGESRGVLLMHELGHAVGLGHTGDQREVMFPVVSASSTAAWGPGDLAGLALVGAKAGCIS